MKWEYTEYRYINGSSMGSNLNALGEKGWELVSVIRFEDLIVFYFKRPIQ